MNSLALKDKQGATRTLKKQSTAVELIMDLLNKIGNTVGKRFIECCNSHDRCYGTCGTTHKGCDDTFNTCMKKECEPLNIVQKAACKATAFTFYQAVDKGGKCGFHKSQQNHCQCK